MAYSLTSLVDKVRQTLQGAVAQAPTTLSNIGNRVVGGYNEVAKALPLVPTTQTMSSMVNSPAAQSAFRAGAGFMGTLNEGPKVLAQGLKQLAYTPFGISDSQLKSSQANTLASEATKNTNLGAQLKKPTLSAMGQKQFGQAQDLYTQAGNIGQQAVSDVGFGSIKSAAPVFGAGYFLSNPLIPAISGALGAGINKFQGKDAATGFGEGMGTALKQSAFLQVTNPLTGALVGGVQDAIKGPVARFLTTRVAQGSANVIENRVLAKAFSQPINTFDDLTAFAMGALLPAGDQRQQWRDLKKQWKELPSEVRQFISDASEKLNVGMKPAKKTWVMGPDRQKPYTEMPTILYDRMNAMRAKHPTMIGALDNLITNNSKKKFLITPEDQAPITKGLPDLESKVPQAPQVEPIGKVLPEVKTQPEILPWETPEYLAKNPLPAGTQPQSVAPSRLKQELNQPVPVQSTKKASLSITPELFTDIQSTGKAIDRKVNLLDYLRTPDRVLEKIGLKKQSDGVKQAYNAYLDELPKQIDKITSWYEQTKADPNAARKLFQYLDGNKSIQLDPIQLKVAGEMRQYLDQWAERLNLPVENRMANYMTHIFEKDFIQKEFDPELAKIIQDKIPGSVYDPFLQQRLGKLGYVEDAFRALDAYTKRAVRKANMDPALEKLKLSSESLDLQSWNYVKSYADRINLRPTELDNLLDNAIKQSPIGYKLGQRPVTAVSRTLRQMVYRGTLGLNVGSALRNLTQGANTYAQLGEKYTGIGYVKALKEIATGGDELLSSGVLRDNVVQDRQLSAVKGVMEKLDSGLFSFFNFAEKINRGAAYFGAKAKYLSEGLSETEAIKRAVDMTRKTQFTFGSVDTPVAMQSDLVKTFTQFQSFNMKQTEFLEEMLKNKEFTGIIRYVGANLLLMATVGQLIGINVEDMIPFSGVLTGRTKLGQTPPVKLAGDVVGALTNAPDKYGNVSKDNLPTRLGGVLMNNAPAFIPGGVQIKKTIEGLKSVQEGGSYSKSGKLQYPVPQDVTTAVRAGLFGKSNLDQAQWYRNNNINVLGDKQTQQYKDSPDKMQYYKDVLEKRAQKGNPSAKPTKTKKPVLKLGKVKKTSAKQSARATVKMGKVKTTKAPEVKKVTLKQYKPKFIASKPLRLGKMRVRLS